MYINTQFALQKNALQRHRKCTHAFYSKIGSMKIMIHWNMYCILCTFPNAIWEMLRNWIWLCIFRGGRLFALQQWKRQETLKYKFVLHLEHIHIHVYTNAEFGRSWLYIWCNLFEEFGVWFIQQIQPKQYNKCMNIFLFFNDMAYKIQTPLKSLFLNGII